MNQHKNNGRFDFDSYVLILSFNSVAKIANICFSGAIPVTQLPANIAQLCSAAKPGANVITGGCDLRTKPLVAEPHGPDAEIHP